MKNIHYLKSFMIFSIIFFIEQYDFYKLCAFDEVVSPLLSTQDPLIESMNGLKTEIMRLNGEIKNTTCCFVPIPWKRLALADNYKKASQNFMNVDIPEEKELFDNFEKKNFDCGVCCAGLAYGSLCLVCLPSPISAISTAPILSAIGISAEVLAAVSCCCCLPSEASLLTYKDIAGKQLAIKQLYTTGKVDEDFKVYLNGYSNAYHVMNQDKSKVAYIYFGIERERVSHDL
jgi:hypothetical protein